MLIIKKVKTWRQKKKCYLKKMIIIKKVKTLDCWGMREIECVWESGTIFIERLKKNIIKYTSVHHMELIDFNTSLIKWVITYGPLYFLL